MGADVNDKDTTRPNGSKATDSDVLMAETTSTTHDDGAQPTALPNISSIVGSNPETGSDLDAATLQKHPQPSPNQRESVAPDDERARSSKKRKRRPSPPWQFPTAELSTLKSVDGRRVSARHAQSSTPHTTSTSGVSSASDLTPMQSDSDIVEKNKSDHRAGSKPPNGVEMVKPISPPWKRFGADGPTTITENGLRKSGRQSRIASSPTPKPEPTKRTSPRTKKLASRLSLERARDDTPAKKPLSRRSTVKKEEGEDEDRKSEDRIRSLRDHISPLRPGKGLADESEKEDEFQRQRSPPRRRGYKRKSASTQIEPLESVRQMNRSCSKGPAVDVQSAGPKIRLKFKPLDPIDPPHPSAIPPSPARPPRPSLYQVLDDLDTQELQQPFTENDKEPPSLEYFLQRNEKQAAEEGDMRRKLWVAGQPGGKLTREGGCTIFFQTDTVEPARVYDKVDHLSNQALYFRQLMRKEKEQHKLLAKKIANEALERWKQLRGPTEEDIELEKDRIFEAIRKQVVVDIRAKWEIVQRHVEQRRRIAWERQEEQRRQERLQKQLEWSEMQVRRQRGELSDSASEAESDVDMVDGSGASASEDERQDNSDNEEESDSDVMSESASNDSSDESEAEMDPEALEAYMKMRQAEPPDKLQESISEANANDESDEDEDDDDKGNGIAELLEAVPAGDHIEPDNPEKKQIDKDTLAHQPSQVEGELDPDSADIKSSKRKGQLSLAQLADDIETAQDLSDDASIDMDSTDYDSDEDMSSSNEGDESLSQHSDPHGSDEDMAAPRAMSGLLGFFSKAEQAELGITNGLPTPIASADDDERTESIQRPSSPNGQSKELETNATEDVEMKSDTNDEVTATNDDVLDEQAPGEALEEFTKQLTPVPQLLRATLRPYQQAGLDWLASLYRNNTNGILADEMGLGKTIQTIALLGHIAETYDIWHPHLIIVPTSVILNWVTEFQKFLPGFRVLGYFGAAEERQKLRKGWVNDPHNPDRERRGYNAIITSYQIALKDINAIRNVHWSYLVLDEAHNIRNFQSQKFQLLIRLRTRARLMLTGTPLQNSLTELWSLLTFLTAGGTGGTDRPEEQGNGQSEEGLKHGSLEEFLSHWKEPVNEIFNRGVEKLSAEAQAVVAKLHISLRPFLLRRLKIEVEKDLPKKTEEVVVCRLSKRQRQLYQEYMGLAEVRKALKNGGENGTGVTAGRVLMQLRRVCNHPDLFDPRPIQTSFALEESAVAPYSVTELAVRKLLLVEDGLEKAQTSRVPQMLLLAARESRWKIGIKENKIARSGVRLLKQRLDTLEKEIAQIPEPDLSTLLGPREARNLQTKREEASLVRTCIEVTLRNLDKNPIYGCGTQQGATIKWPLDDRQRRMLGRSRVLLQPKEEHHPSDVVMMRTGRLQGNVLTLDERSTMLEDVIKRYIFVTPAATAPVLDELIPRHTQSLLRASLPDTNIPDAAHEARIRNTIAFPDRSLLIFDSGKLQRLTVLLRQLQSRNSRSLIFTQMTATLNILEQFLSLQSIPYLRLDGSTSVERRQLITSEFNRSDSKYQCMILSSRAGGVGLNLVGASSVIFYDLDWNPQMDRQCMDRAHRIGQVRDVSVYKMVSERTVEENILRRAGQKALLDQTVIQEGRFTTDYNLDEKRGGKEEDKEIDAAFDALLSKDDKAFAGTMETVEDTEDVQAAAAARKEEQNADEADFADKSSRGASVAPTGTGVAGTDGRDDAPVDGHVDLYMIRWMEEMMRGVPFVPPPGPNSRKDKNGRDRSHRPKKR